MGHGAILEPVIIGGIITSVNVIDGGSGYDINTMIEVEDWGDTYSYNSTRGYGFRSGPGGVAPVFDITLNSSAIYRRVPRSRTWFKLHGISNLSYNDFLAKHETR